MRAIGHRPQAAENTECRVGRDAPQESWRAFPELGGHLVSIARLASFLFDICLICLHDPVPGSDLFHWNRINDSMPGPSAAQLWTSRLERHKSQQLQNKLLTAFRRIAE